MMSVYEPESSQPNSFYCCGINHNISALTDKRFSFSTEPKRAAGQNQFIRVIGLTFLIT